MRKIAKSSQIYPKKIPSILLEFMKIPDNPNITIKLQQYFNRMYDNPKYLFCRNKLFSQK
jgi:hypothetical protein